MRSSSNAAGIACLVLVCLYCILCIHDEYEFESQQNAIKRRIALARGPPKGCGEMPSASVLSAFATLSDRLERRIRGEHIVHIEDEQACLEYYEQLHAPESPPISIIISTAFVKIFTSPLTIVMDKLGLGAQRMLSHQSYFTQILLLLGFVVIVIVVTVLLLKYAVAVNHNNNDAVFVRPVEIDTGANRRLIEYDPTIDLQFMRRRQMQQQYVRIEEL